MLPAEIEKPLSLIELQCEAVAAAVATGEPQMLENASNALQQAALDFSGLMERLGGAQQAGPELRARLKKLAVQLNIQRENLIRRSVVVERALHAMVPATRKSTYAAPAGRAGSYKAFSAGAETLPKPGLPWAAFFVSGGNLAGFVGLLSGGVHDGALGKRCGDKHLRAKPGYVDELAGDVIPHFCGFSRFVNSWPVGCPQG